MMEISKPQFENRVLQCVDCDSPFDFTVGEQEYFWIKGLATPKRCPRCRKIRRISLVKDYSGQGRW